ncbi:MAG: CAP domain-containing protein [Gemmatimonadota bacterium]
MKRLPRGLPAGLLIGLRVGLVGGFGALAGACGFFHAPAPSSTVQPRLAAASRTGDSPEGSLALHRRSLLAAVNADRAAAGAQPVALDRLATDVAQAHAEAMARGDYLSHLDAQGRTPYERMAAAGGMAHVRENVFRWQERWDVRPPTWDPWRRFDVRQAERHFMDSPGHRATILDPRRTHVGLGIAVDPARQAIYVVQEFLADWAELGAPRQASRGTVVTVAGRMRAGHLRPLLAVVRREEARATAGSGRQPPRGAYADGAGEATVIPPWTFRWEPDGRFTFPVAAGNRPARLYGVLYVAPARVVTGALAQRSAASAAGWPGAAFVLTIR